MKTQQKIICVLVVAVLLANTCLSALADDGLVMTQAELEAAWALTGLDENAARYREGMAFSENMNARQMELWLDEVLNEEASAVQQLFSQLENTLYKMKQENPALYDSLTENRNGADYLRLKESYVEAENLRQLIRYYRDQLNIKANVIQSRMERIGNANYSLSAQLTASREIEEAARVIQKIRGELTQNALSWVSWLTSTHGSMTGTSANNGLGTDDGHAQWIESILTYGTRPAVSTKTSASVLYPNEGRSLTARLLPVSSALADSSEEITVMAVDENHFGIQTLSKADGSPLSGSSITVTGLDNGYSQTETTDDTGAVTFNANDFAPNADGEVNLSIEASSSGQQSYLVESTVMQKGGIRKDNMENDEGTPYVLAASFKSRETHDILMGTYTAFYSKYNDDTFDLKITASQHCTVTLQYVDVNGNKQTVSGETGNEDNSVTFSKTWKNMVKPGTKMTVSLSGGKTKDLGLSFVKGVNEQPITAVTNLLSIFSGGGITFTLPGKYLKPLGDMSVNFSIPWEQYFSVRGIGTLDGTFILYAGAFADCSDQVDWLQNNWKTIDQEGLEKDIKALEDNQQSTKDALKNGLTNGFNGASPQKHPVLGNMTLSLTAGGMFLGKYIKTGSGSSENWQYSFEFVAGAVAAFDYSLDVYFIVTPFPIYLDIRLQLSTMVDVFLAFMASMEDGNRVKAKFDYNAGGLSFTIRFTVTVGVTLGLKGVFTVTIGGYFYIQITLTFSNQGFEGTAVLGGGVFLEVKAFCFFTYRWNIYEFGGELVVWNYSHPWKNSLSALVKAAETEDEPEDPVQSTVPEDYPALVQKTTYMMNISLSDVNVRCLDIHGDPYICYLSDYSENTPNVCLQNLRTGDLYYFSASDGKTIYSFDVAAEKCDPILGTKTSPVYTDNDFITLAFVSTTGFTEKETVGLDGETATIKVPNDSYLTVQTFILEKSTFSPCADLPDGRGGTFTFNSEVQMDRVLGNVQMGIYQEYEEGDSGDLVNAFLGVRTILDDAVGDKYEKDYAVAYLFQAEIEVGMVFQLDTVLMDEASGIGTNISQMRPAKVTKWSGIDVIMSYLAIQDGALRRIDTRLYGSDSYTIENSGVSFFTVFADPEYPDQSNIFYLVTEEQDSGSENAPSVIRHLKAAKISYAEAGESSSDMPVWDMHLDTVELDVTIPGSAFQIQWLDNTVYLYWLETAPKEKETDPNVYRLRGLAYDPARMVATDDFVLAQFSDYTDAPVAVYLAKQSDIDYGYFVRDSGEIHYFLCDLVSHTDLRGMTTSSTMVRSGTDIDLDMSVMNDGNTSIGTLDLEMVLADQDGNIIKGDDGRDKVIQTLHADFVNPENSSRTVYGDAASSITGAHTIYRTDDLVDPTAQKRFNVQITSSVFHNYLNDGFSNREDLGTTTTAVSSSHILPGELASLTMSVHIPAEWNGEYHIIMRLKDTQGNGLLSYGSDSLRLTSSKRQNLKVNYRLYPGPNEEEYLGLTIYNYAKNGENLRLYAEMYLDSSADPIYVDLPYYPELTSAGMTHSIDMPVSALLNGRQAQKVELRILAAGADEFNTRDNQVTFYLMDRSAPLSLLYQPVDTTVLVDEDAMFSVVASGGVDPYQYQWQEYLGSDLGWRDISGATESTLTVRGAQLSMNGKQYRCKVKDHNLNEIVSDPATLKVVSALPPTGDQTHLPLYLTLAAAALLLAAAARYARKKREQTRE